jgi:hypothetical protein
MPSIRHRAHRPWLWMRHQMSDNQGLTLYRACYATRLANEMACNPRQSQHAVAPYQDVRCNGACVQKWARPRFGANDILPCHMHGLYLQHLPAHIVYVDCTSRREKAIRVLTRAKMVEFDMSTPASNRKLSILDDNMLLVASQSTKATGTISRLRVSISRCRYHLPLRAFSDSLISCSPCYSAGRHYERTSVPWKVPDIGELHPFSFQRRPSGSLNKHWINILAGLYTGGLFFSSMPERVTSWWSSCSSVTHRPI